MTDFYFIMSKNISAVLDKCIIINKKDISLIKKGTLETLQFLQKFPSYISGFYDAEANINCYPAVNKNGKMNFECEMKVSQNEQEIHILLAICLFFPSKNVGYLKVNQHH